MSDRPDRMDADHVMVVGADGETLTAAEVRIAVTDAVSHVMDGLTERLCAEVEARIARAMGAALQELDQEGTP